MRPPITLARLAFLAGCLLVAFGAGAILFRAGARPGGTAPLVDSLVAKGTVSDALHAARLEAETVYVHVSDTVTQTRIAYHTIRDSFPVYPATKADTERAIAGLPQLVQRSDAAVAAGARLQVVADSLRTVAVAEGDTLRSERAGWKTLALKPPNRFGGAVAGLYDPVQKVPALSAELHVRIAGPWDAIVRADQRFSIPGESRVYVGAERTF